MWLEVQVEDGARDGSQRALRLLSGLVEGVGCFRLGLLSGFVERISCLGSGLVEGVGCGSFRFRLLSMFVEGIGCLRSGVTEGVGCIRDGLLGGLGGRVEGIGLL